ncbi:Na(+)-translocating NADH-quinone reductase subunit C [Catenovulum maritimum]|uniref:Na(+)-translocating NADH-quinone reductase subunit C n=1 Tax=Catenovulum maritimum TaxID=1513271 RepID=A0A0J8GLL5_9ALTE|nr:Na(+)-translocating NADH-quinone reductase subunit C [Catenovulum maritimum]KMT63700.1 Na(+)-translocating NADH-quinone reductase subunit C [Catenovulum maritimum]
MSSNKETFGKTVGFVLAVCLVCAALVSISAVGLKPMQLENKLLDKQTKILEAAGLLDKAGKDIPGTYKKYVEAKLIELDSGKFIEGDVNLFDERSNARDVTKSSKPENDIAGINRRSDTAVIYLVKDDAGQIDTVVLPIVGSGLWDLMFGFIGFETDLNTVKNVIYSDHKETPGLGAEVQNPKWIALWKGKKMFDEQGNIAIEIVKGGAKKDNVHGVDGLSGATLTSNGVERTLHFWLGNEGYGPFIANVRDGGLN